MKTIYERLFELSIDPLVQYDIAQANEVPTSIGLSADEIQAVRAQLAAQPGTSTSANGWQRCAACFDPGYDPLPPDPEGPVV